MTEDDNQEQNGRPRLVLIEPNASGLKVLAKRLREEGYRLIACSNVIDAIAELHRNPVDLVISELRMLPMSGIELVRMIRDDSTLRETPTILITGKSDANGAVDGFAAGADDVVAKPFHFEVLLARIERRLAIARTVKELHRDNARLDARIVTRSIELSELRAELVKRDPAFSIPSRHWD